MPRTPMKSPAPPVPADPAEQVVWSTPVGPGGAIITSTTERMVDAAGDPIIGTVIFPAHRILTEAERDVNERTLGAPHPAGMAEMRVALADLQARVARLEGSRP